MKPSDKCAKCRPTATEKSMAEDKCEKCGSLKVICTYTCPAQYQCECGHTWEGGGMQWMPEAEAYALRPDYREKNMKATTDTEVLEALSFQWCPNEDTFKFTQEALPRVAWESTSRWHRPAQAGYPETWIFQVADGWKVAISEKLGGRTLDPETSTVSSQKLLWKALREVWPALNHHHSWLIGHYFKVSLTRQGLEVWQHKDGLYGLHLQETKQKKRPWTCWYYTPEGTLGKVRGERPADAIEMLRMLSELAICDANAALKNLQD